MTNASRTWPFLAGFCLLVAVSTAGTWIMATRSGGFSDLGRALSQLAGRLFVVAWVRADRRARAFRPVYEFDAFLFFAVDLALIYYLWKTRRWRGILLWLGFFLLLALPEAVAVSFAVLRR